MNSNCGTENSQNGNAKNSDSKNALKSVNKERWGEKVASHRGFEPLLPP